MNLQAQKFIETWRSRGDEKSDTQQFWTALLHDVYGVEHPENFIRFEQRVKLKNISFMDATIPFTSVLIEQKSSDVDLDKKIRQSDGSELTPLEQAKRYDYNLPKSQRHRWIIACNFREFRIFDAENPTAEPIHVLLENLEKDWHVMDFLVDKTQTKAQLEQELSIAAGALVGKLYDALLAQYRDPTSPETLRSLNILCVRLVFCFYAEDADIFGKHNCVCAYLAKRKNDIRRALIDLFHILNQKDEDRDPYLDDDLRAFPYVNGGLFEGDVEIPRITPEIAELLTEECSRNFDWSGIDPTIFGAVFESTLNPETRRSGGMHYTSTKNIHRVIDPLFFSDLQNELTDILAIPVEKTRERRLKDFRRRLASLTFFDPACGSGNFLTETYLSIRRLENKILEELMKGQMQMSDVAIQVGIDQFYGIEINDFAVSVARTALWIAESQMLKKTEGIVNRTLNFLPLHTQAHIVEGNALRLDWETVVPGDRLNYIIGNPPFVGARFMSPEQKNDLVKVFGESWKNVGNLDYVCAWYKKATDLISGTGVHAAFVSTNSICQGEQVPNLWKPLFERGLRIDFAWRTFRWDSEATLKAHVHCVIVGFSCGDSYGDDASSVVKKPTINPDDAGSVVPVRVRHTSNDAGSVVPVRYHDRYFNPDMPIDKTQGNLPHWDQTEKLQFVTFRLADSLPQERVREWSDERERWLAAHPKPWDEETEKQYYQDFEQKIDKWLDKGYGSCVLSSPDLRKIVADAILFFDNQRYIVESFVIMPNHVHVLLEVINGFELGEILHSWKSFTANKINKVLNLTGAFWQKESYDTIIRGLKHFQYVSGYIKANADGVPADKVTYYYRYGQKYGDDASSVVKNYGDDASSVVKKYGDDVSSIVKKYGDDVSSIVKKYGDDASSVVKKYGDDASSVVKKPTINPDDAGSVVPVRVRRTSNDAGSVVPVKKKTPVIYDEKNGKIPAKTINPYLIDAPMVFIESRNKPICAVPEIGMGNQPIDGGNYLFKEDEKEEFVKKEPESEKYFRRWYGSDEFINNRPRWCLWLGDCPPHELRKLKHCMERVENVRKLRAESKRAATQKMAQYPTRFQTENMPKTPYILVPKVSSERRFYVPLGFMQPENLTSDLVFIIPNATLYHFGVLTSSVHMAWMRAVCGRLKSDYRYSKDIVYNNFPWPVAQEASPERGGGPEGRRGSETGESPSLGLTPPAYSGQNARRSPEIERTAQGILDARALYPDCSLADLYDVRSMPDALRRAHEANDKAVLAAYGFPKNITEPEIVAELMKRYEKLTSRV